MRMERRENQQKHVVKEISRQPEARSSKSVRRNQENEKEHEKRRKPMQISGRKNEDSGEGHKKRRDQATADDELKRSEDHTHKEMITAHEDDAFVKNKQIEIVGGTECMDITTTPTPYACGVPGLDVMILEGHDREVCACAWAPTGSLLASGSADSTARIWNLADRIDGDKSGCGNPYVLEHVKGRQSDRHRSIASVDWNGDGSLLASSYEGHARIWTSDGVVRRRIYDIINILGSIGLLTKKKKNLYSWRGFGIIPKALQLLKSEGPKDRYTSFDDDVFLKADDDDKGDKLCSSDSSSQHEKLNGSYVSKFSGSEPLKSDNRKEKCLGLLTQNFVKLFLCSDVEMISLEEAQQTLLGAVHDQSVTKTRIRRLYDIANVLSSMNFIEKTYDPLTRKPVFRWTGMRGKPQITTNNRVLDFKKRTFGTDLTNARIRRRMVASSSNATTRTVPPSETRTECGTAKKVVNEGNLKNGPMQNVQKYQFGPFAAINAPQDKSKGNNDGAQIRDWESLAITHSPQYQNQGKLKSTLRKHKEAVVSIKWNRKGDYVLTGSLDTTASVWDVKTNELIQHFELHSGHVLDIDWCDNVSFAASTEKLIHVCKIGLNCPVKTFPGHQSEVNSIRWDPTGSLLASSSDDTTVKIWSLKQDNCIHDFREHRKEVLISSWSPTGQGTSNPNKQLVLASASFDSTVKMWDVEQGKLICNFNGHRDAVYSIAFSPDGEYLASGSKDNCLNIWSVKTGKIVKSYAGKGIIFEVSWNKEGDKVAACNSRRQVCVLDFRM